LIHPPLFEGRSGFTISTMLAAASSASWHDTKWSRSSGPASSRACHPDDAVSIRDDAALGACRKTSVSRTTGTAAEPMMSASTWPGATDGSWSTSPTRIRGARRAGAQTGVHHWQIDHRRHIEVAPQWIVLVSAARPLGAARAISMRLAARTLRMALMSVAFTKRAGDARTHPHQARRFAPIHAMSYFKYAF
jgi:hypothetical protein